MKKNYLLGNGELLTHKILKKRASRPPEAVYSFEETIERLTPQLNNLIQKIETTPSSTKPNGINVAKIILHPKYIARSYFPKKILRESNLENIGSRTVGITPNRIHNKKDEGITTTEIFVSGRDEDFIKLTNLLHKDNIEKSIIDELIRIENIEEYSIEDKLIGVDQSTIGIKVFEIGLHLSPQITKEELISQFSEYCSNFEVVLKSDLSIEIGNLVFLPLKTDLNTIYEIAKFSLVRLIRSMPTLRKLTDNLKYDESIINNSLLIDKPPLSLEPRVAILDGGLPANHYLSHWTRKYIESDPSARNCVDGIEHGLAVSGAFLFGPIETDKELRQPYSYIDHHRILDAEENEDDFELYRTLGHIEDILVSKIYSFINLSLGPHYPIDDNDIHPWTAMIDDKLKDGETFMSIAIGNNGRYDEELGLNRIQVPADCVNAVTVGACDHQSKWLKADYSPVGPGRSPGIVKPDLLAFGGSTKSYFHVLTDTSLFSVKPTTGTSFAAPYLLRQAVGIRAYLGKNISPLAIKALLIHKANDNSQHKTHIGWGKIPEEIEEIIFTSDDEVRIIYQGVLEPSKTIKAIIPVPNTKIDGKITITATICYASHTDPEHVASYTKAGLDVVFKPHKDKLDKKSKSVSTDTFFESKTTWSENDKREASFKWETVRSNSKTKFAKSLCEPCFEIHYNAREDGASISANSSPKLPYAMIITLKANKHNNLYEDVKNAFNELKPIIPTTIHTEIDDIQTKL